MISNNRLTHACISSWTQLIIISVLTKVALRLSLSEVSFSSSLSSLRLIFRILILVHKANVIIITHLCRHRALLDTEILRILIEGMSLLVIRLLIVLNRLFSIRLTLNNVQGNSFSTFLRYRVGFSFRN
jgi:hypothetical protein